VVGLVIVSHSAALADGVAELAREMGGGEVPIETAGGLDDGAIGTDAARVLAAVDRARSADGVIVLMDLGSALMSAEMAVEMAEPDRGPIVLAAAPLVEGAVAAAARARGGASLDEVAAEARGALRMKLEQLGEGPPEPAPEPEVGGDAIELRLRLEPRLGLHARPAARFVAALAGLDARVEVRNVDRAKGPADGRSLTALATLGARNGDELAIRASGAQAAEALDALRALAAEHFGDPPDEPGPQPARPQPAESQPAESQPAESQPAEAEPAAPARDGVVRGVPASPGVAVGPARHLRAVEPAADEGEPGTPEQERGRLEVAREEVRHELEAMSAQMRARGAAAEAEIFDAHVLLLEDSALTELAARGIDGGATAGAAWRDAVADAAAAFRALDDPYLAERAVDVEDVGRRVLARLAGTPTGSAPEAPGIVIAGELTPGEAAGLDPEVAWAIATGRGGATGHAAILARALGIPAVVGAGEALLAVAEGARLALDGDTGVIEVDPDDEVVARYLERREAAARTRRAALEHAAEPAVLSDGKRIEVFANVGSVAEARRAAGQGAEGIGLLRTEFLFLDRATPPDEDEQVDVLRDIARALDGRPVVVRTLDAGADKPLPFLRQDPEDNPFLGLRGIRLSLAEPELFDTQLRAIARVAEEHPLKLMFPMVSTLDELREAKARAGRAREAVGGRARLDVGVMVEVPALALQATAFAEEVDFFSVGTNDLAQYTMAAERGNAALAPLLEGSLSPVLALIAAVARAADARGRWVGVCGELAGDPEAAILLAGLGVRELSMSASRIPAVKAALRSVDLRTAAERAREALPTGPPPDDTR
jgi:phosphocarrier protein FPr